MAEHPGTGYLDGGWWPRSLDLAVELVNWSDAPPSAVGTDRPCVGLAARLGPCSAPHPGRAGRCVRRVAPARRHPPDRPRTADRTTLRVLVVPPGFTRDQGEEALLASATAGNAHSATDVLEEVTDQPDAEPRDRWTDDGASWWGSDRVAPSFRTAVGRGLPDALRERLDPALEDRLGHRGAGARTDLPGRQLGRPVCLTTQLTTGRDGARMRFIIETNLAQLPGMVARRRR